MRILVITTLLLGLFGGLAAAQQPAPRREVPVQVIDPATQRAGARPTTPEAAPKDATAAKVAKPKDRDRTQGSSKPLAFLFWAFALGVVGGAIFVITRRNLIAAVMGMVATFFAVAGTYMMLYAGFLSVIQMLVYAGAIMVLFVFVVMILNKPEDEPWALVGIPGKILAGLAMLYLTVRLGQVLIAVEPPKAALEAPRPVDVDLRAHPDAVDAAEFGSTKAVGSNLFGEYLFPFEAVSILLLVAVVGAIAVARPLHETPPASGEEEPTS